MSSSLDGNTHFAEYHANPATAGFTTIEITPTHQVADGVHSTIIRTVKPNPNQTATHPACN